MADEKKPASTAKTTTRKVVAASPSTSAGKTAKATSGVPTQKFTPTEASKKKALTNRILAAIFWAVAIGLEMFTIFWILKRTELKGFMVWLIAAIVVIGILAIIGSQLWKRANRYDPASEKDTVRFFIQNQLGVIITIIAFLPLIILIFLNDDMKGSQKAIAGTIGIVVMAITGLASVDWNPPSIEKMTEEQRIACAFSAGCEVYWVEKGSVYHLCSHKDNNGNGILDDEENNDANLIGAFKNGTSPIQVGTLEKAVEEGKFRLSMYGFSECGYDENKPVFPACMEDATNCQ
ncbi:MAG: hypothetical protein FWG15_08020 [Propionibacteriaceae bacterium]|nr:hypothetical protein [Propionibacteriaceae bacterium]